MMLLNAQKINMHIKKDEAEEIGRDKKRHIEIQQIIFS